MIIPKGTEIVCTHGHMLGSVTEDILDGQHITSDKLRIKFDVAYITPDEDGYICRVCNEKVAELRAETFRVQTARGWVG